MSQPKTIYDNKSIQRLFGLFASKSKSTFGWYEAIIFGGAVDFYHRYSSIITNMQKEGIILDIGCGKIGIGALIDNPDVICLDIDPNSVKSATGHKIIASASNLPFRPIITTSVSADCYEHLPASIRKSFIEDITDISEYVLIHFPTGLGAITTDKRFEETHTKLFGFPQPMHTEHLRNGHPELIDTLNMLPSIPQEYYPDQNSTINYILFVLQSIPIFGWTTGILFKILMQKNYNKAPYYSILLIWRKEK